MKTHIQINRHENQHTECRSLHLRIIDTEIDTEIDTQQLAQTRTPIHTPSKNYQQ